PALRLPCASFQDFDFLTEEQARRLEPLDKRPHHLLEAAIESRKQRRRRCLSAMCSAGAKNSTRQAAGFLLYAPEAREHGGRAQVFGIPTVHSRKQRVRDILNHRRTKVAADETRCGLIGAVARGASEQLSQCRELRAGGQQR